MKAGGFRRAYIETVPVEVTNGEFRIVFTAQTENPAINAIEIVPQAKDATGAASSATTIRIKAGLSTPFTDSSGQVWQPDQGFEGGMTNQFRAVRAVVPADLARRPGGFGGRPGGFGRGGGGSGAGYASAIAIDFDGQRQYVQLTAKTLVGVAASDGKVLWRYDRPANRHGHQLLHAHLPRRPGVRRLGLRCGRRGGEAEQGRQRRVSRPRKSISPTGCRTTTAA